MTPGQAAYEVALLTGTVSLSWRNLGYMRRQAWEQIARAAIAAERDAMTA
jgi:hypothetical protein